MTRRSEHDAERAFALLYARAQRLAEGLSGDGGIRLHRAAADVIKALASPALKPAGVWHPYGFFVVKVALLPRLGALRLHVWPEGERRVQQPCWPAHCHRWNLASCVLAGALGNAWYEAVPGDVHPLYAVSRQDGASVMTRTVRRVMLREVGHQHLHAGGDYVLPTRTFHATDVPVGTFAATIALTTLEPGRFEAFVAGDPAGGRRYVYERAAVAPSIVENALGRILEEGR